MDRIWGGWSFFLPDIHSLVEKEIFSQYRACFNFSDMRFFILVNKNPYLVIMEYFQMYFRLFWFWFLFKRVEELLSVIATDTKFIRFNYQELQSDKSKFVYKTILGDWNFNSDLLGVTSITSLDLNDRRQVKLFNEFYYKL